MHYHSTSSHRCRSHRLPGLLLILSCLTGVILAQTFQYSRGWTNGRKRGSPSSPVLIPSSGSVTGLFDNNEESSNPCNQLQRIRFLLGARNPQQFFFPCDSWRDAAEVTSSGDVNERFRRRAPQDALSTLSAGEDHENN